MHSYPVKEVKAIAWFILVLAAIFCAFEFIIRVMVGPITQYFLKDFSATTQGVGFLSAAFFYGYAPVQLLSGYFFSRFGPRQVLLYALGLCSFALLLFSYNENFYLAIFLRFLTGVGSGFAFIGAYILIANWFPSKWWAWLYGMLQLVSCIGAINGQYLFALYTERLHWRNIVFTIALFGLSLLLLFIYFIKDSPSGPKRIKHPEKLTRQIIRVLHNSQSWWIASYALLTWGPIAIFATLWGPSFLVAKFHLTIQGATLLLSATWLGVGLGSPFIGLCHGIFKHKKNFMILCALTGFFATSMLLFSTHLTYSKIYFLLFLLGFATSAQPISFVAIQEANDKRLRGVAIGINQTAVIVGGAVLQPLSSFLIQSAHWMNLQVAVSVSEYIHGLILLPFCYFFAVLITYFAIKEKPNEIKVLSSTQALSDA